MWLEKPGEGAGTREELRNSTAVYWIKSGHSRGSCISDPYKQGPSHSGTLGESLE